MTENAEVEDFLKVGLQLYVDARTTLYSFEQELQGTLRTMLDSFLDGHCARVFRPTSKRTLGKSYGGLGDRSPYTAVWRSGMLGTVEASLILGIWWRPGVIIDEADLAIYTCSFTTGAAPKPCPPPNPPRDARVVHPDFHFLVPYCELPSGKVMAEDAHLLLNEFVSAFQG